MPGQYRDYSETNVIVSREIVRHCKCLLNIFLKVLKSQMISKDNKEHCSTVQNTFLI